MVVAEALGRIGSAQAVQPLINLLKDSNHWVRRKAIGALRELGRPECVRPLLKALQEDASIENREKAAEALGSIGSLEVIPPLFQLAQGGESRQLKKQRTLLHQNPFLRSEGSLQDEAQREMQAALKALRTISRKQGVRILLDGRCVKVR